MISRLRSRAAPPVVAIALGGVLALFATAGPAVAFFSGGLFLDVQVESPARLVARGAAVDVPLEVTCNASSNAFVTVNVTQKVGKGVAQGTAFTQVACSGSGQQILVRVTATSGGKAFTRGQAVGTAEVSGCLPNVCGSETDSEVINVRR
jgi:hypothetical protein